MPNAERDLNQFLRRECFRERKEALTGFSLRHAAPGAKGTDVDTFDIPEDLNSDNLDSFVEDIVSRAQSDANGMGPGIHRYVLHAMIGDKTTSRCAFRLSGHDEELDEGSGEESPNMRGLLQQLMRHNEQQARTMNNGIGAMVTMLARNLESRDRTIERMMEDRAKAFEQLEAARSQEHEREMALMIAHGSEQRKDQVFEKIGAFLPIIVNKIAGTPILPVEEKAALKGLVATLTPEQFQRILEPLTTEQKIILMTAVKSIQDEEKKQLTNGAS